MWYNIVMGNHRWSGWPGAFCMYCGSNDPMEYAIANNWYDPFENKWDTEEHRKIVEEIANDCPVVPEGVNPYSLPYPMEKK